jgi:hypothetical protein
MKMFGGFHLSSVSGTHGFRENEKKHFIVILIMIGNCYEIEQESQENGDENAI